MSLNMGTSSVCIQRQRTESWTLGLRIMALHMYIIIGSSILCLLHRLNVVTGAIQIPIHIALKPSKAILENTRAMGVVLTEKCK